MSGKTAKGSAGLADTYSKPTNHHQPKRNPTKMRTIITAAALITGTLLTGCQIPNPMSPAADAITGHDPITGDGGWHVVSQTIDHGDHVETRYPNGVVVSATTLER